MKYKNFRNRINRLIEKSHINFSLTKAIKISNKFCFASSFIMTTILSSKNTIKKSESNDTND